MEYSGYCNGRNGLGEEPRNLGSFGKFRNLLQVQSFTPSQLALKLKHIACKRLLKKQELLKQSNLIFNAPLVMNANDS